MFGCLGLAVGHVSLETGNEYISLWPESGAGKPQIKWNAFKGGLIDSLKRDEIANGTFEGHDIVPKKPDTTILLNGLDRKLIEQRFNDLKNGDIKWALVGDNKFFFKEGIHSCASLVMLLLKEGGLENNFQRHGKTMSVLLLENPKLAFNKFVQDNLVVSPANVKLVLEFVENLDNEKSVGKSPGAH